MPAQSIRSSAGVRLPSAAARRSQAKGIAIWLVLGNVRPRSLLIYLVDLHLCSVRYMWRWRPYLGIHYGHCDQE